MNAEEKELFTKFCTVLAKELIPYLNKCLQALFPSKTIGLIAGVGTTGVDSHTPVSLDISELTKPLSPMLPNNTLNSTAEAVANDNFQFHAHSSTENYLHENELPFRTQDTNSENTSGAIRESKQHDQQDKQNPSANIVHQSTPTAGEKLVSEHSISEVPVSVAS